MPTVQAGDDVIDFPDSMSQGDIQSVLNKKYREPALDYATKAPLDLVSSLQTPLKVLQADARETEKERLAGEMVKARKERRFGDIEQAVTGGEANVLSAVKEFEPLNLLKRTMEIPAQLSGTDYKIQPAVTPQQVRDFLVPTAEQAGSVSAGVQQAGSELLSGFTSPDQVAALAAGKVAPELVARLFQTKTASDIPPQLQGLWEAVHTGDTTAIAKAATSLAATTAIPAVIEHGVRASKASPEIPELRPAVDIDGKVVSGTPGESHGEILESQGKDPESIPHESQNRGFIRTSDPNTLIPRKESAEIAGVEGTAKAGGLDSRDIDPLVVEVRDEINDRNINRAQSLINVERDRVQDLKPDLTEAQQGLAEAKLEGRKGRQEFYEKRIKEIQQEHDESKQRRLDLIDRLQSEVDKAKQPSSETVVTPKGPQMGAAGREEAATLEKGTGLKNAVGELERVGLGLHEAPETVQRNMAQAWAKSGEVEAAKPGSGEALAKSLIADPERGLTDADSALLLRHKVDLWNRLNDAAERSHTGDAASRAAAQADHAKLLVDYGQLLDAVKQRGSEWGREGRWRQAMAKEDFSFSSTDDLNRYHRTLTGEDLPGKKVEKAGKIAAEVKEADQDSNAKTTEVMKEIDKKAPKTVSPDAEKAAIDAANKTVREAAVMVADAENKARVAKTVRDKQTADIQLKAAKDALEAAQEVARKSSVRAAKEEARVKTEAKLNEQAKATRKALDAANKVVRDAAMAKAEAETATRVARTADQRKVAKMQEKAAQRAVDAADKRHRDAERDLAKAQRALRDDPIKAVWSKVREQIDKGEGNFDDIRNKVAIELGMKVNQVTRIMAQDGRTKRLMDDAWRAQRKARDLRNQAKAWVAGADTPEAIKALKGIPNAAFWLKTLGHGTVPLGTHAPFVLFQPNFWPTYFKRYGTMYHMVGSKAFYEQMVQDLQRRPNYIKAQRNGLVNDPTLYEDYTSPEFTKQFSKGGANIGVRGFAVLKILRQDMFDQRWDKLPKSLQTDEMAKAIADGVNHDTGVVQAMAPRGVGTALFAPRLFASRVASLAVDPARAALTAGKVALSPFSRNGWLKTSPAERNFAIQQVTSKAMIGGTLYGLLIANQGLLNAVGSNQTVNLTDPMRSDFLKFKVAGMNFAYGNAMISLARMPLSLYRVVASDDRKSMNIVYDDESAGTVLVRFARSQLSPFMGTLVDLGLGSDFESRPLPSKVFGTVEQNRPVPKRVAAEGFDQYTWPEYWMEQASPIPFQEAIKEVWHHGLGMNDEQVAALGKAIASSTIMGATGGRLTVDREAQ